MAGRKSQRAEERRREIIARIVGSETVMAQHRASKASYERGEPAIPAVEVWGDEERRGDRAPR
jgi:hypothetical protein